MGGGSKSQFFVGRLLSMTPKLQNVTTKAAKCSNEKYSSNVITRDTKQKTQIKHVQCPLHVIMKIMSLRKLQNFVTKATKCHNESYKMSFYLKKIKD